MRILHVNYFDKAGGAAIAAYRLHTALLKNKIESLMLVCEKMQHEEHIIGPPNKYVRGINIFRPLLDQLPLRWYKNKTKTMFSPAWVSGFNIVRQINRIKPDIVHLHWINNGMMTIKDLTKIEAPIVWSLHDMWPFTGGCHYDENCSKYITGCSKCPVLKSKRKNDKSKKIFKAKQDNYSKIKNLTVIGLSKWIAESAKSSELLGERSIIAIPNLINTNLFKPIDTISCRKLLNLDADKQYILYGAMGATSDPRKGFKQLQSTLDYLINKNVEFVVFGSRSQSITSIDGRKVHYLGKKSDDETLVAIYNACDVIVVPSLQENLSNIIMEALSCGTPVVAFDIGGNGDQIIDSFNGYTVPADDTEGMAKAIESILDKGSNSIIRNNARQNVINNYAEDIVSEKYISVYNKIILNKV